MKKLLKMFVVKKYVMANSAQHALRLEKKQKPDDAWVDEDFRKKQTDQLLPAIGFKV